MLRFWLDGKTREEAFRTAKQIAKSRTSSLQRLSDVELLAVVGAQMEKVELGRIKAKCVSWRESIGDGSHLFLVQVWGDGFTMGGWLLAFDGFRLSQDVRSGLSEEELRDLSR